MSPVLAGEVLSTLPPGKFTWHNLDPMVIMYLGNTRHVHSHKLVQEAQVQSLDWEDPLEKEMATPSSILALRVPWTE